MRIKQNSPYVGINCGNRNQSLTFGYLCNVGVCDTNVRDPFQVSKGTAVDSSAFQRVGPKLWGEKKSN